MLSQFLSFAKANSPVTYCREILTACASGLKVCVSFVGDLTQKQLSQLHTGFEAAVNNSISVAEPANCTATYLNSTECDYTNINGGGTYSTTYKWCADNLGNMTCGTQIIQEVLSQGQEVINGVCQQETDNYHVDRKTGLIIGGVLISCAVLVWLCGGCIICKVESDKTTDDNGNANSLQTGSRADKNGQYGAVGMRLPRIDEESDEQSPQYTP